MHSVSALYSDRGCEEKALEYAERALALSPASLELQLNLAGLSLRYRHWEAAATLYEELTHTCGRSCDLLSAWARALHGLNDPRAEALLAEAAPLAQSPGDFLILGETYAACGQVEAATAAFRRCLAQTPLPTRLRHEAEDKLRQLAAA
jgi:tetratricopeptide (TPR) repeat protein